MARAQIFISHTQKDRQSCDLVDKLFARFSITAFRSEYENIQHPEWQTIKSAMNDSIALFLLVGPQLVKNQRLKNLEWSYTQNWIAYEMGLACQLGIDVWAICDGVSINFPMPYVNNYFPMMLLPLTRGRPDLGLKKDVDFIHLRYIIGEYSSGNRFSFPYNLNSKCFGRTCNQCGAQFNLHLLKRRLSVKCPQCLKFIPISQTARVSPWKPRY